MVLFSIIATTLFIPYFVVALGLDWYIQWNMKNLPLAVLVLYPRIEALWRWIRFWLYA